MNTSQDTNTVIYIIALCRFSGVRPRVFEALLRHFRSLERIFKADAGSLMSIGGMTTDTANKIAKAGSLLAVAREYYEKLLARDIKVVTRLDRHYPQRLFELNDPPTLIFYRGTLPAETVRTVAVAGGENATNQGIELTVEVAKRFAAAGVQVISSLSRGIDSAAHLGSSAGNGPSFSVLQSGLDNIYPEDNRPLAIDIVKDGGLLSESPPEDKFDGENFKASNRIIAALSQAVVATEFYHNSHGVLDLLKCCSEIGKLAFIIVEPRHGALTDKESFDQAVTYGAIPMVGLDKVDDIVQSLV